MPNQSNDQLFQLIKTLSKAEKRGFKIYATRTSPPDAKFIQLFDAMDKAQGYDESAIIKKVNGLKKRQFSNLKAHLYKQVLISLRLINAGHNIDIQIREQIDYARILYNKGLYGQSLSILERTKELARENHRATITHEILVFEKIIESQYITRSLENRAEELIHETCETLDSLDRYNKLSNLSLRLYSIYIKNGHVRNQKDYETITRYFKKALNSLDLTKLGFYEELYLYVSYAWYSLVIQDFLLQYRYAQKWVDLFRRHPEMQATEPIWYMKGMHVLLEALFVLGHYTRHEKELQKLDAFIGDPPVRTNQNLITNGFIYSFTSKLNSHFIAGTFSEGIYLIPEIKREIDKLAGRVDPHRVLIFYYKFACMYFGAGDNKKSIHYLNKIINYPDQHLREDLQCFSRILNLIAHYELGNRQLVEYQIRSTYRFLSKMNDLNKVQAEILKFLGNSDKIKDSDIREEFRLLLQKLLKINEMPFQKRHFLYLDVVSWLESKISEIPVQEVIQAKFKPRSTRKSAAEHHN